MANKRNFWVNLIVYLLFPVVGAVINVALDGEANTGALLLGFMSMFFGFFYYLGYEHFWYRPTLAKVFRIIGLVLNILLGGFMIMGVGDMIQDWMMTGAGAKSFLYAFWFMPILFALFRRSIYEFAYKHIYSEKVNMILSFAVPVGLYLVAVIFSLISFLYLTIAAFLIWHLVRIYINGYVNKFQSFLINLIYHIAFLIVGTVQMGIKALPYEMLFFSGWMTIACGFFYYLAYDFCQDYKEGSTSKKIFNTGAATFWAVAGALTTGGFGIATILQSLSGIDGMSFGLRCGFDNVFFYALYYFPIFYACTRYYVYDMGWMRNWGSRMRLTVTLAYPIVCYVIAVIALLIGALWFILAFVLMCVIITIVNRKKYSSDGSESTLGFNDPIKDKPEDEKTDDRFSGIGLDEYLGYLNNTPPSLGHPDYQWKDYTFNVSRVNHRITVSGVIVHQDAYNVPNWALSQTKEALSYAYRMYKANYKNTIKVEFHFDIRQEKV